MLSADNHFAAVFVVEDLAILLFLALLAAFAVECGIIFHLNNRSNRLKALLFFAGRASAFFSRLVLWEASRRHSAGNCINRDRFSLLRLSRDIVRLGQSVERFR